MSRREYNTNILPNGLPNGFTQLQYIQSTGTQYIKLENPYSWNSWKIEGRGEFTRLTSDRQHLFGNDSGSYEIDNNGTCTYNGVTKTLYGLIHTLTYEHRKITNTSRYRKTYTLDGELWTGFESTWNANSCISFFKHHYAVNEVWSRPAYAKLYYAKLYQDDVLIHDFLPAKRNSDNIVGLYDIITNTFYTNNGTGTFLYG